MEMSKYNANGSSYFLTVSNPAEYKAVHIISLRQFAEVLRGFLKLGRFHVTLDDGQPTGIEVLLDQAVKRLV
jgi:hypothetical protein